MLYQQGLNPIETVTELRAAHAGGAESGAGSSAGVNVRRGRVTDMRAEHVLQPLHVTASALALATETVRAILKIDDIVRKLLCLKLSPNVNSTIYFPLIINTVYIMSGIYFK